MQTRGETEFLLITEIEGLDIHFIHVPNVRIVLPLIVTAEAHGIRRQADGSCLGNRSITRQVPTR